MKLLIVLICLQISVFATSNAAKAEGFSGRPQKEGYISELSIRLSDFVPEKGDWIQFVKANAGKLKSAAIQWNDFSVALYNASSTSQLDLSANSKLADTYRSIVDAATPVSLKSFEKESSRDLETLRKHLYAVHSTDFFPMNETIGLGPIDNSRPLSRPTVHFAIGGLVRRHHVYTWDNKPFAIVTPLKNLEPQLLNLMVQDTFVLGEVKLKPGTVIIVPAAVTGTLPTLSAGIEYYQRKPNESIRSAIDTVLDKKNAWKIAAHMDNTNELPNAYIDGVNLNHPKFFEPLLKAHPTVTYGSHIISVNKNTSYGGIMDVAENFIASGYDQPTTQDFTFFAQFGGQRFYDTIQKDFAGTEYLTKIKARYQQFDAYITANRNGNYVKAYGASNHGTREANIQFFLLGLKADEAVTIINKLSQGLYSPAERFWIYRLQRQVKIDKANGELNLSEAQAISAALKKEARASLLVAIAIYGFNLTGWTDENNLSFSLGKDDVGKTVAIQWLEFLRKEGLLQDSQYFGQTTTESFTTSSQNLACVPDNQYGYIRLIRTDTRRNVGANFSSMAYCNQAISGATPRFVCGIDQNSAIRVFYHGHVALPVGPRTYFSLGSCNRRIADKEAFPDK